MGATIATTERRLWIGALVLAAVSGGARAHDPGLSTLSLRLSDGDSRAQFELVVRDAELPAHRRASSGRCRTSEVVRARVEGSSVPASIACRSHDAEHTSFVGTLRLERLGELRIELPLLDELPRGHQVYASAARAAGGVPTRRILARSSESLSVRVEPAPPPTWRLALGAGACGLALLAALAWLGRRWLIRRSKSARAQAWATRAEGATGSGASE